ncbi:MAG: hypothetical protein CL735_04395 [Chloroflexi bacterium]|nr:hypothetical protein [Chloroflexota bacterium]
MSLSNELGFSSSIFALLISGIVSMGIFKFLDEPFTMKTLPVKLVSVILIFFGVTILTIRG